ncbi:substrate-binding and vWA domain-containing protein [Desulfitobacterium chlororespirans]|uniref:Ca-activated chloride channel family protein n=1 Tax=Desulfitobacterium chlororespirans DSM 11544 TaxID=1121395 RepID=A0A1M7TAM9_9FIRM|nr:VWA domain-containing protein [Desulfitobacterium chlororespirans]SHN67770.1 Ca-activated chloride channel family protein [Desulfitobacterium chlororespirans DSM 11544]
MVLYRKIGVVFLLAALVFSLCACSPGKGGAGDDGFTVLSSSENKDLEPMLSEFARENNLELRFEYTGSLNIPALIKSSPQDYDAVWSSNSIWNASIPSSVLKNSKSISVNPVIFAVKESRYKALGFSRDTVVNDLVKAVEAGNLKFLMPSVTQTNSGASAYIGFLNSLAGNPPVLTEEDLTSPALQESLKKLFKGVARNSGSDEYLIDIFREGDYDALVNYESSLIELNKQLIASNKEPLLFIYPSDGVSVSDSPFAYIDNNDSDKLEVFNKLQDFLLSADTQKKLESMGRRTTYGGLVANLEVFKESYGIDKNAYLSPIKYPASPVLNMALTLYQDLFRKPSAVVFCLDYSGSMYGEGNEQLVAAMERILNHELAAEDLIQFSEKDQIVVIPFAGDLKWVDSTHSGTDTAALLVKIKATETGGGTDIYRPVEQAIKLLKEFDSETYTKSIVLMTDGESGGRFSAGTAYDTPVFSIMFGKANPKQLDEISRLTRGKTFDGKTDLINAFKEIRAYN